jgi:hypothetical protein
MRSRSLSSSRLASADGTNGAICARTHSRQHRGTRFQVQVHLRATQAATVAAFDASTSTGRFPTGHSGGAAATKLMVPLAAAGSSPAKSPKEVPWHARARARGTVTGRLRAGPLTGRCCTCLSKHPPVAPPLPVAAQAAGPLGWRSDPAGPGARGRGVAADSESDATVLPRWHARHLWQYRACPCSESAPAWPTSRIMMGDRPGGAPPSGAVRSGQVYYSAEV